MAAADGSDRRRRTRRQHASASVDREPTSVGRTTNTEAMAPASLDPSRDLPTYLDRARTQLAELESARRDHDPRTAAGVAWMLRATLGSARTLLDETDRDDLAHHRETLDSLVAKAEPILESPSPAEIAERGTRGFGGPLPFLGTIQASFGRHDISGVRAHMGGVAAEANHELGAHAFAFGGNIAFAAAPDLHTAAHEAAHVIQQRAGVALKGAMGQAGDVYERHADAVADAVVSGHSAEALLDQMVGQGASMGSSAAVQRKDRSASPPTSQGGKGQAPNLDGAPYRWVQGSFNFWISARWFKSAGDFQASDGRWSSPSRSAELLGVLRSKGMLTWTTPERIKAASAELEIEAPTNEVHFVRLGVSVFDSLGLPPGTRTLVGKRAGGLEVVVAVPDVDTPPGKELLLSPAAKQQIVAALESFTDLKIASELRHRILEGDVRATMGAGTSTLVIDKDLCGELFGKDEFARFYARGSDSKSRLQFDVAIGSESYGDLSPEEVAYTRNWLERNLPKGKDGSAVAVNRELFESLKRIDTLPDGRRQRVLALLRGGKRRGDEGMLTSFVLERAVQEASFEEERERAGFHPEPKSADAKPGRPPVFDMPVPARIDQSNGLVIANETVEFFVSIDWPPAYMADHGTESTWRNAAVYVEWLFERTLPDGGRREFRQRSLPGAMATKQKLSLEKTETEATWIVHAFVRHSSFQPKHETTRVQVKTEQRRLEEMRAQSFAQLGEHHIDTDDYDFETSLFNEALGDREYDHGKRFRGELPKDFARRTPEQRQATLAEEIKQTEQILQYLRKQGTHPEAVSAAEHYIAKLRDAQESMDSDVQQGWQPFEIRGTFLGRGGHIADGSLDLYGAVRRTKFTMPSGAKIESVSVQIRDLSRRFEAENYRFDGKATTYEKALELAFVDLCKKYPRGTLSILAEGFEPDGSKPNGKTVGFELDTGTAWEDVKSKVFDPAVNVAVNIASAVVIMLFPPSIPILLPATILYNETQNIDQMIDSWTSGTLTGNKAFMHMAQLGLDIFPMLGRAPIFRASRFSFAAFEVANLAGQAILMKEQVQETIRQIRDTQVRDMAELYAQYVELEKSTNASDPNLAKMRAELDRRAEAIRKAAQDAWLEAAASFAIVALPTHAVQMLDQHLTVGRRTDLQASRRMVHVDGVEPHYDPHRGQIVGDQSRMDRATLDHLTKQQDAHMEHLAERIADDLGVSREKVTIEASDQNRIWKDGDTINVRYAPGTDVEAAVATWRAQAKDAKIGHVKAKATRRGEAEPHDTTGRRAADEAEIITETANLDPDLARDTSSHSWETTAAAVPGSSFRGNVHPANAEGVLAESRAAVTSAAGLFSDISSVDKVSTKHLDPESRTDRDEKPHLDDTWLIRPVEGEPFTIRITSAPLGSDAVARTVVNPSKRGASFLDSADDAKPIKVEVEGRYVVQVNDSIDPAHAERALAHEIAEILAERELARAKRSAGADLLKPGEAPAAGSQLSPHDRGRIGELKALAAKVNAGDPKATREMIALVEELGLRDGVAGAAERRRLVTERLADDRAAVSALDRVAKAELALDPELKAQLAHVRQERDVHIAESEKARAQRTPVSTVPDAGVGPGETVSLERAKELELQAAVARARRSAETVQAILEKIRAGEIPEYDIQVGGGAGLAARDPNVLLIDARRRWQADASKRIAQTANQLRGLKDAGLGDPFQFAAPNERVPMSAIRFWEDSIAARGPVIDGHVTNISIDAHGRTIVTIKVTNGPEIKVKAKGSVVMSTGFPIERMPGTPRGMTPDRAVDQVRDALSKVALDPKANDVRKAHAQKALKELEELSGLESQPGMREADLAEVKKVLARHGLTDDVQAQAKGALDMVDAGDKWAKLRKEHPDRFVLGDMANLETLDAHATDKWIIGGPGGTGISAAEIVLERNKEAHVTMIGEEPPPGLIENDQFVSVVRKHGDPQTRAWFEKRGIALGNESDNRFSVVLGIKDLGTPSIDRAGKVHVSGTERGGQALGTDFVPAGYDKSNNPLAGAGGYISAIGRDRQLPPVAAALKDSLEAQGGKMTMHMLWQDRQYVGYRLRAFGPPGPDGVAKELQAIDVTGAASRFPPVELMSEDPMYKAEPLLLQRHRKNFEMAGDIDAPPESGNFDGGFVASATQAARYASAKRAETRYARAE